VLVWLGAAACSEGSVTGPDPSPAPGPAPAPAPAPTPAPAPSPVITFAPGQHRVGTDIQPGRYYSDPGPACYWERQSGAESNPANTVAFALVSYDAGQWVVDIRDSDHAFEANAACGTWFSTPRRGTLATISGGVWAVGIQISPGMYQTAASAGCHWERLRDFTGTPDAIAASDTVGASGVMFVTIAAEDAGFRTDEACGTWTRVN
jgi:hypothetical protein